MIVDNNGATLMDGNMTNYNSLYSNNVDGYDIWKMTNPGENFGILRSAANLVIERRNLVATTDTTYFRMWNMQVRNYRIQVIAENLHLNNLTGVIHDSYLNKDNSISLNDTTDIDFSVTTVPASYASNRFTLIYKSTIIFGATLPVTFTGIQVQRKNNSVQVNWTVENELNLEKYIVEQSTDGANFKTLEEVVSANTSNRKTYSVLDNQVLTGDRFYRIKAISVGAKVQYSSIARIGITGTKPTVNVYPNPIVNKTMQLQLNTTEAGAYRMKIIQNNGTTFNMPSLQLQTGASLQTVQLPQTLKPGIYQLQLTAPDQSNLIKTILVL